MFFLIFVSNFFYLILDSIPFFPPFFLFFSSFSFSFFSFFFSFLDTKYNPTSTPPEPVENLRGTSLPSARIFYTTKLRTTSESKKKLMIPSYHTQTYPFSSHLTKAT